MPQLQDKVALITGGQSGIGLASATLFVREGAKVVLVGIEEAKLKAAVEEIGPDHAVSAVADVTDSDAVAAAVATGVERFGPLDVVFSNAGISGEVAKIVDYPEDVFARTLAVHIGGAFHVLKHTLPRMNDGGSIIITSSVVGEVTDGLGAHVVFDAAGVGEAIITGIGALAPRGKVVVVGIHEKAMELNPVALLLGEAQIVASLVYTDDDYRQVIDSMARGEITGEGWVDHAPLDDLLTVYDQLRRGERMKVLIDL